jgi:pimeloyl-ACP methyl ester carboxylesterase
VALDMRGYNESDKLAEKSAYAMQHLVADVRAVIDQLGGGKAVLVGHDWGGAVAWAYALAHEKTLDGLIVLNLPHPAIMLKAVRRPPQLFKSWYVFFFQLPVLPEAALTRGRAQAVADAFKGAASPDEIEQLRAAFLKPGVATAAINYYRNIFSGARARSIPPVLKLPTLLLWGERDPYLGKELTDGTERWVKNLKVVRVPEAGHFLHQEQPELVNEEIREFVKRVAR